MLQESESYLPMEKVWFEADLGQETVLIAALAKILGTVEVRCICLLLASYAV